MLFLELDIIYWLQFVYYWYTSSLVYIHIYLCVLSLFKTLIFDPFSFSVLHFSIGGTFLSNILNFYKNVKEVNYICHWKWQKVRRSNCNPRCKLNIPSKATPNFFSLKLNYVGDFKKSRLLGRILICLNTKGNIQFYLSMKIYLVTKIIMI